MLDYTKVTPPLSADCHALTQRMLSLVLDDGEGESSSIRGLEASSGGEMEAGPGPEDDHLTPRCASGGPVRAMKKGRAQLQPSSALTQLTVNEYLPGQGIAQHIGRQDKHAAVQATQIKLLHCVSDECASRPSCDRV
jgi:hypothetical protein